ncbi:MAG: hypothetical protein CSB13_01080 [Chloroflexi bacterium]|nr:MAG: hypothetical protein CSB13_01080 [Chloroflexota bacterium]
MTTQTTASQEPPTAQTKLGFFKTRRGRAIRENLTAYLFLSPALFIVFTFGIFPILFAGYVSLYKWRIKQNQWRGLDNYINAMGDPAYIFFGVIVLALVFVGIRAAYQASKRAKENELPYYTPLLSLIPGIPITFGLVQILLAAITFFAWEEAIEAGEAARLGNVGLGVASIIVGLLISVGTQNFIRRMAPRSHKTVPDFTVPAVTVLLTLGAAYVLGRFTYLTLLTSDRFGIAVIRLSYLLGALAILVVGFFIWRWGSQQQSNFKLILSLIASAIMIGGAVWLANIWPVISMDSDPDFYQSLSVTMWYSIATVPVQLGVSMVIAYLLYQPIRGRAFFRIVFFIPYIAPAVATAGIFQAMFSLRGTSLANQLMVLLGGEPQRWLHEPNAALSVLGQAFGIEAAANWQFGPSLALLVVILYNIWVYVGYDTVIFLAGLGAIPNTLYEAARIDGAGRWSIFRHVTFPLLSPTTYFLSVISVIGTFKAFNHIFVLRQSAAQGTVDAASVHFFVTFQRASRFGYATSMAITLFVVILTLYLIQNRIAERSVHYG